MLSRHRNLLLSYGSNHPYYDSYGKTTTTNLYRLCLKASSLSLLLVGLMFVFLPYIVVEANAESTSVQVSWQPIVLELNTGSNNDNNGNVNFNNGIGIVPSSSHYGTLATSKRVLEVNTTAQYFKVFLSMSSDASTQNLCYVSSSSGTLLCDTDSTAGIAPIASATPSSPQPFTGTSWGFAIADDNLEPSSNLATNNAFSSAASYQVLDNGTGAELTNALTTDASASVYSAKWASVPLAGDEALIWDASTTNAAGFGKVTGASVSGDNHNTKALYYGVMVGTDLISGSYQNKITYTALASANALDSISNNMVINTVNASSSTYGNIGGPTDLVRLDMDLSVNSPSALTSDNIEIKVFQHSNFDSETNLPQDGASPIGDCELKNIETTAGNLTIKCTMPGTDSANSTFGLTNLENTDVDFLVKIQTNGQSLQYSSHGGDTGVFRYVGLQTRTSGDNTVNTSPHYVQSMQQVSAGICKMTNQWPNEVQHVGSIGNLNPSVAVIKRWADSDDGSYKLSDNRDGKAYLVRRLADGNCWMVQNLDLDLFADVALTSSNTDLGYSPNTLEYSSKSWTPISGIGNDQTNDNIDNSDWKDEKNYEKISLYGYINDEKYLISTCSNGTKDGPCYAKSTTTGNYKLAKIDSSSPTKADTTDGVTNFLNGGICSESTYTSGCKIETENTNTNYIITQFGNLYGYNASSLNDASNMTSTGDWRWDQTGADGTHVYDQGPLVYSNSFSGDTTNENVTNPSYNLCTQSTDGTAYSVTVNNTSGSLKDAQGNTVHYTTCTYADNATDADGRTSAADPGFVGNWYNWYAATAGSGTNDSTTNEAEDSICPRGWRLPAYDGNHSFHNLLVTNYQLTTGSGLSNADTALLSLPLNYIRSGFYDWTTATQQLTTRHGRSWGTKPHAQGVTAYASMFYDSLLYSQSASSKGYGYSIRCVAR